MGLGARAPGQPRSPVLRRCGLGHQEDFTVEEPEADASCRGAELLPSFRPLSRCRDCARISVAALSGHDLYKQLCPPRGSGGSSPHFSLSPVAAEHAGPGVGRSGIPAPAGHHPQVTRGPGCFRRKAPRPLGRHCPWAGSREGGADRTARMRAGSCPEDLPGSLRMPPSKGPPGIHPPHAAVRCELAGRSV